MRRVTIMPSRCREVEESLSLIESDLIKKSVENNAVNGKFAAQDH
jgi:hypothetical protein